MQRQRDTPQQHSVADETVEELTRMLQDTDMKKLTCTARMDAATRRHLKRDCMGTLLLLMKGVPLSANNAKRKIATPYDVVNGLKYEARSFAGYEPYIHHRPRAQPALPPCTRGCSAASQPCTTCKHPAGCICEPEPPPGCT